jgi:hypothetical protein
MTFLPDGIPMTGPGNAPERLRGGIAGLDAQHGVRRAEAEHPTQQRNDADPTPNPHGSRGGQGDQSQPGNDSDYPISISNIDLHGKTSF